MNRTRSIPAVVLLATVALLGSAAQANAYSGTGWDGTDPNTTGCDAVAINPVNPRWISTGLGGYTLGKVELRYSPLSGGCQTAWARLVADDVCGQEFNEPYRGCGEAYVVRDAGSPSRFYSCAIGDGQSRCWSKQIYDGAGFRAHAAGYLPYGWYDDNVGSGPTASW
jgi:hypothetical protein